MMGAVVDLRSLPSTSLKTSVRPSADKSRTVPPKPQLRSRSVTSPGGWQAMLTRIVFREAGPGRRQKCRGARANRARAESSAPPREETDCSQGGSIAVGGRKPDFVVRRTKPDRFRPSSWRVLICGRTGRRR